MAWVTVPGESPIQLHCTDSGGDGRPVVLIHGWPLSGEAWSANVDPLVAAGHRVITYDRRGFGRSDHAAGGYEYDTLADDLHGVMEAFDLHGTVLVGHSMGGGELARYLARHGQQRVAGAVLASAITPALCQTTDNPDGGMPFEGFATLREQCAGDRDAFLDQFMTAFFSNADGMTLPQEAFAQVLGIAGQGAQRALEECILAWATDLRADVAAITVPTLVIHGDADNTVPFEASGRRAAAMIPSARLHVVAGGPHGIPMSHAEEFNTVLLDFLASL
ncbi:MAG: alpha/beta fold hydrolase [Propioniciclava sp.]